MKIYTRKGDKGKTSLLGGKGVDKDSPRIQAYGTVDELNAVLGLALLSVVSPRVKQLLLEIQNDLFSVGADLARASMTLPFRVSSSDWKRLESWIDEIDGRLPPLRNFVLPGGSRAAALIHLARATCRRAERLTVTVARQDQAINAEILVYLNRLSDLLFVLARFECVEAGGIETVWKGRA